MSRLFDDAATQYLERAAAILTGHPLTMACWFYSDDAAVDQVLMSITDNTVTNRSWDLMIAGSSAGDPVRARANNGNSASTTTGYSVNTWMHACGVYAATNDRRAYINGGSKGTNSTASTLGSRNTTAIGRSSTSSPGTYMSGRIAECAIWNIALTDAEVAALATGVSPRFIHPEALVFYAPLIGVYSPEVDFHGGATLTVTGATQADHTRVFKSYAGRNPMTDVTAVTFNQTLSATPTLSASMVRQAGKIVSATPTLAASISRQIAHTIQATLSETATIIRQSAHSLSASVTLTASLSAAKTILQTLSASVSSAPTIARQTARTLSSTLSLPASMIRTAGKSLTANPTLSASLDSTRAFLKTISAILSMVSSITRSTGKSASANVSISASVLKQDQKPLVATVLTSASMSFLRFSYSTLTAALAVSADMARSAGKNLLASVVSVSSFTKSITSQLNATVVISALLLPARVVLQSMNAIATLSASIFTSFIQAFIKTHSHAGRRVSRDRTNRKTRKDFTDRRGGMG